MAIQDSTFQHNGEGLAASLSAVSWGAILAGATATAVLSVILLILGTGLGLSSVSAWSLSGISATAFGVSAIVWLSFTQIVASGMGGYLAGRLRSKWANTGSDEVYFRDTAHGFLSWSVSTLVTAVLLTSIIGSIINGGVQAGAAVANGVGAVAKSVSNVDIDGYFVDSLFRRDLSADAANAKDAVNTELANGTAPEVLNIFVKSMQTGSLAPEDTTYVAQLIAKHTNISQADAEKRVNDTFNKMKTTAAEAEKTAREAAETARKASAYAALWLFVSLLIGAFSASLAATWGGRSRDA